MLHGVDLTITIFTRAPVFLVRSETLTSDVDSLISHYELRQSPRSNDSYLTITGLMELRSSGHQLLSLEMGLNIAVRRKIVRHDQSIGHSRII